MLILAAVIEREQDGDMDTPPHRKLAKTYNTSGHLHFLTFSCFQRTPLLTNPLWLGWLADSVRQSCDQHNTALWSYVFMPEHVHLLVKPRDETYDVTKLRHAIKQSAAKRIVNSLIEKQSPLLAKLIVQERPGKRCYRFWQEGPGHDKNVWSLKWAIDKTRYCHFNPVKRGLVSDPSLWRWSSFRWIEGGSRDNEPLRIDDWEGG